MRGIDLQGGRMMMTRLIGALFLLCGLQLMAETAYGQVAASAGAAANCGPGTSCSSGSVTISGSNRAGVVTLLVDNNAITGISCDIGGTAGTAISGADTGTAQTWRILLFGVVAPPTGSQVATCSWTGTVNTPIVAFIPFTGASQSGTTFNGGTSNNSASATTLAVTVTSTSGDLTTSAARAQNTISTDQTQRWAQYAAQKGDTGPGSGSTTHTYTDSVGGVPFVVVGANVVQVQTAANTQFMLRRVP